MHLNYWISTRQVDNRLLFNVQVAYCVVLLHNWCTASVFILDFLLFTMLYGKSGSPSQDVMVVLSLIATILLSVSCSHPQFINMEHLYFSYGHIISLGYRFRLYWCFSLHFVEWIGAHAVSPSAHIHSKGMENQMHAIHIINHPETHNFAYWKYDTSAFSMQCLFVFVNYTNYIIN